MIKALIRIIIVSDMKFVLFNLYLHQPNQTFFVWRWDIYTTLGTREIPKPFNGKAKLCTIKVRRASLVLYPTQKLVFSLTDESVFVAENLVIVPLYIFHSFTDLATEISKADMKVFVGLNTPLRSLFRQFKHLLFLYQLLQLRSCLLDVERIGTIVFHQKGKSRSSSWETLGALFISSGVGDVF